MTMLRRWMSILGAVTLTGCGGGGGGPGPGPTAVITKTGGDPQVGPAGQALGNPLEVTVKDGSGNNLSGRTVTWSAASGGGFVAPTSVVTGIDGKATTTRTLGPGAGPQTTTASVSGATTATFSHVAQIQGATQMQANVGAQTDTVFATLATALSVLVREHNNLPVAGVTVTWTAPGNGAQVNGSGTATTTTNASGVAAVTYTLGSNTGAQLPTATVNGLIGSPVTITVNATAGNASSMALNGGGTPQVAPVSTALPTAHSVIVRDAYNNPKANASVTWVVGLGGGSTSPAGAATTNASGIASVTRTLGANAGVHTDTASITGVTGSPVVFTDTAAALVAVQVSSNQFTPANETTTSGAFARFTWTSGTHNVTWSSAPPGAQPPDSPTQSTGTYTARLTTVGTYAYFCTIHGSPGAGMNGTILVQ